MIRPLVTTHAPLGDERKEDIGSSISSFTPVGRHGTQQTLSFLFFKKRNECAGPYGSAPRSLRHVTTVCTTVISGITGTRTSIRCVRLITLRRRRGRTFLFLRLSENVSVKTRVSKVARFYKTAFTTIFMTAFRTGRTNGKDAQYRFVQRRV